MTTGELRNSELSTGFPRTSVDRIALRHELEEVVRNLHALLIELTEADWAR
jgi:hypothetical protein